MQKKIEQLLKEKKQEHLMEYYNRMNDKEKSTFVEQLEHLNWKLLDVLQKKDEKTGRGTIAPLKACTIAEINEYRARYESMGMQAIRDGKIAAVLLAGGQGSRLGYDGPKGTVNIGIHKELYIFEMLFRNTMEVTNKAGAFVPFYIMTSQKNHEETVRFLKEHDFFGYPKEYVSFFTQEMAPCVDLSGKILMEDRDRIALSPNGNGGWFSSMDKKGILDDVHKRGVEWLNVFAVDNVLQKICDPVFLGAVLSCGAASGAKVVRKADPKERVGVMCLEDGKPSIIEYYEMTEDMVYEKDASGEYAYNYGVILNYLFRVDALEQILRTDMPIHFAEKKIPYITLDGVKVSPEVPNGYKFEEFILDMIHLLDQCLPYEVERKHEFAPIKNSTGVDSIESARKLLKENGVEL